jgi:hypothetical protein
MTRNAHQIQRFINMPCARDSPLAPIELFQQERGIVNCPAVDSSVVHLHASLGHHLLKVPQAQALSQIPPDTEQVTERSKCLPLNTLPSIREPREDWLKL